MSEEANNYLRTAKDSLNSLIGKFDISKEVEHRQALILSTDAAELALKALFMKRLRWTKDKARHRIRHRLVNAFKYYPAPQRIVIQVTKFDNNSWSWERRYPEVCYAAETCKS